RGPGLCQARRLAGCSAGRPRSKSKGAAPNPLGSTRGGEFGYARKLLPPFASSVPMPITSHPLPWLAALCSMGAVAVWAAPAGAYCRTTTCDPSFDSCQVVNGCVQGGKPLRWPASCVSFGVQRDGSERRNIDYATALDVINAAFQRWTSADCGGGS